MSTAGPHECHAIDGDEVCGQRAFADVVEGAYESWPICRYHAAALGDDHAIVPREGCDA